MKTYKENVKELHIIKEVDVLVVGSGPAGIGAAIGSARLGAKTLIIEQQSALGGVSTSGLMSHWVGRADSGIYREVLKKSAQRNEREWHNKITKWIDHEKLKLLYLEMLTEENVDILLYTFLSDVIMEKDKIVGVIVENKSGRSVIMAKRVVDATGDGDVAFKTGVPYFKGRESDGKMQPVTLMFKVAGVDTQRAVYLGSFEETYETDKGEIQALARKHMKHPLGHVLLMETTLPGVVNVNMSNITNIDGTKAEDLTRAEIIGRKQVYEIEAFLREFVPGYENCFVITSAQYMGIRETRHFIGESQIQAQDIETAKHFDSWVVKGAYFNFDVHNLEGAGLDPTGVQHEFKQERSYTIPFGCIVPTKVENLLLSGRNVSASHIAHSNLRAMPICMATGEAAGIAAAISVKENVYPRQVEVEKIQDEVNKNLELANNY